MKTFFHPDQLLHIPQTYLSRGRMRTPQEIPQRAEALVQAVRELGYPILEPADQGLAPLQSVHSPEYLEFLQHAHEEWQASSQDWGAEVISNVYVRAPNSLRGILAKAAAYLADGSCPVGPMTWRSAYWSAQAAISAADAVLAGERFAYGLCRPPGHHARRDAAGGFCYLNNAAVAAQRLRQRFDKVAVLDTDVHHGQGVQEIFYDRSDVLYVSVHADPTNFYPVVAGFEDERGVSAGVGFNRNFPVPHGASEATFFEHVDRALAAVRGFAPQALVFAHGFDIFENDPQTRVQVSTDGFGLLGARIASLELPTVILQEGGYDVEALPRNAKSFFEGIAGRSRAPG